MKYHNNKMDKRAQIEKMYEQMRKTQRYKNDIEQSVFQAYTSFCLITCDYLQQKHGYKKNGLKDFTDFARKRRKYLEEQDGEYFVAMNDMFIEECGVDVLKELGLRIETEENNVKWQ